MSVQIIIDSACDMSKAEADRLGLVFLPLSITIDGETYLDGVTLSHHEFYEKLATAKTMPKTSQVNPATFEDAIREAVDRGDEVVVITLSCKVSGTYQSACIARSEFDPEKVFVVDSLNVSLGERVVVDQAVRLRDKGLSAAEIAAELEIARGKVCIMGLFETLEYLYKGGRLSRVSAIAGSVLNIKPVMSCYPDGSLAMLGKMRGSKQGFRYINENIALRGGVDFDMPYMLGYAGNDDQQLKRYIAASIPVWLGKGEALPNSTIGATIGAHVGPGTICVAFYPKGENIPFK